MSLLIIGSIALDNISNKNGEVKNKLGGSAVYASIVASYLYNKVSIIGVVGNDFPRKYIKLLKNKGIDTKCLEIIEGKTFRWTGKYENMNKAITLNTSLNVFTQFCPKIPPYLKLAKYIFLGNIDPEQQIKVIEQLKNPDIISADTMNYWIKNKHKSLKKMLKMIDILFLNEDEVKMISNEEYLFDAAKKTLSFGPKVVIVKQGEYGSFAIKKNNFYFFAPIFPIKKIVDTTGAGDCFAGGFMAYIASKNNFSEEILKRAIIYGSITSSFNIEGFGVDMINKISYSQIIERYKLLKNYTYFE